MVWKPHGILDQALVNEIVAFLGAAEERVQKPFNRFADLSALDAVDLNFSFVFHTALHRRLAFTSHPPVKTAFYVTGPDTTHYAKLHALLTDHSPLHVSLFTERAVTLGRGRFNVSGAYTYIKFGRLTNMTALMWSAAVIVFLIGLISEQITALTYRRHD